MTEAPRLEPIICPSCNNPTEVTQTRYGRRDDCEACGLHSWDGKPLVSQEVHDARKLTSEQFDRIWKAAEAAYEIEEKPGTESYEKTVKRIRSTTRNRAYKYLAFLTGLPEPECHMASQTDIEKLRLLWKASKPVTAQEVRDWWKDGGKDWWESIGKPVAQERNEMEGA